MDKAPPTIRKPSKPRIPDHLRRRALVSCDRCKQRRIRCLRPNGTTDSHESCQGCAEAAVPCKSTLPRKTRIYGSVESLSHRYRVLDALVKGLFPHHDTSNIETLHEIADSNNISLVDINASGGNEDIFNNVRPLDSSPDASMTPSTPSKDMDVVKETKSPKPADERLVPTPAGQTAHYVGPSSSFGFSLAVRNLTAIFNKATRARQTTEQAKLQADFANSKWSKALEPKATDERRTAPNPEDLLPGMPGARNRLDNPYFIGSECSAIREQQRKPLSHFLPERGVADALVQAFFDRVHPNYLIFHLPTFQTQYDRMWETCHVALGEFEPALICSMFMVLVFGIQVLETPGEPQFERRRDDLIDMVQSRVYQLLSTSNVENIQALLLLQLYIHNNSERNTSFMLLGCASRMAMALGMHRDALNANFTMDERELRRRLWWTLYIFEQNACTILGRPAVLDEVDINVGFPNERILDDCHCVPLGYVQYTAHLTRIISTIRRKVYCDPAQRSESVKTSQAIQLMLELESWYRSLPPRMRLDDTANMSPKHLRAIYLLHVQYYNAQAFLTRPFKLRKVTVQVAKTLGQHVRSQDLDEDERKLSDAASTSCRKGVILLYEMLSRGIFDGLTWVDGYFLYHQVYILAFDYLGRHPAEKETAEDMDRKKAVRDVMGSLHNIRLCPSFSVLTQVAFQMAKIVGIFDPVPTIRHDPVHYMDSKMQDFQTSQPPAAQEIPAPLHFSTSNAVIPLGTDIINGFFSNPNEPASLDFTYFGDAFSGHNPFPAYTTLLPTGPFNGGTLPGLGQQIPELQMTPLNTLPQWTGVEDQRGLGR